MEFEVVTAHQLLHHLTRPVDAIREFSRVAGPGGLVALREVDYGGIIWYPEIPELDDWLNLFLSLGRSLGGEPAAGRRLLSWAQEAGLTDIVPSASVWLYAEPQDRAWLADSWAQRVTDSDFAEHAIERGMADRDGLRRLAEGWRTWASAPDGWLLMPHAEILARGSTR